MRSQYDYIRNVYRVPVYDGQRVLAIGDPGVVIGARGGYVKIRLNSDGEFSRPRFYHPTYRMQYEVATDEMWDAEL